MREGLAFPGQGREALTPQEKQIEILRKKLIIYKLSYYGTLYAITKAKTAEQGTLN